MEKGITVLIQGILASMGVEVPLWSHLWGYVLGPCLNIKSVGWGLPLEPLSCFFQKLSPFFSAEEG